MLAVAGVSLSVQRGEVVGVFGPNGAGKSTLFALLCGRQTPDRGAVWLNGTPVTHWPLHRRARAGLAYLPQHSTVFPRLTAQNNLVIALDRVRRPRSNAADLLELVGLGARAKHLAGTLSGGERRRLELARCLALRPKVLVLDEPFAGVDSETRALLAQVIRARATDGLAVVLTDHQLQPGHRAPGALAGTPAVYAPSKPAAPLCDHTYRMEQGVFVEDSRSWALQAGSMSV